MSRIFKLEPELLFIVILRLYNSAFSNFPTVLGHPVCPLFFSWQKNKDRNLPKEVKGHLRVLCFSCLEIIRPRSRLVHDEVLTKMRLSAVTVSGRSYVLAALLPTMGTPHVRGQLFRTMNPGAKFRKNSKAKLIPNSVTAILMTCLSF